jgi:hypothetical protein
MEIYANERANAVTPEAEQNTLCKLELRCGMAIAKVTAALREGLVGGTGIEPVTPAV